MHIAALWGNLDALRALLDCGADVNVQNSRGTAPLHFAAGAKKNSLEGEARYNRQHLICPACLGVLGCFVPTSWYNVPPPSVVQQADSPEVRVLLGGPDQRLFDYAVEGRMADLAQLLASGAVKSLKVVDSEGCHVLNLAVQHKQDQVVQLLLQTDPELAVLPDMTANTPLHWACQTGNTPLVQQILQGQPEINMQNLNMCEYSTGNWSLRDEAIMPVDKTPLHLAVEAGQADVVQLLLAAGARHDLCDYDGSTPLHIALENQDEAILKLLLAAGADPQAPSRDVCSPLHAVAQRGPLGLMQLLLEHKAAVQVADSKGWTPLHLAARAGNTQKLQCLLSAGAAAAAVNSQGNTPLHLAAVNGHTKAVQLLLAAGADPSLPNGAGRSAIDMAKTDEVKALLTGSST
eukprot:gene5218-5455_t